MASRILNRRELRRQADDADEVEPDDSADGAAPVTKKRKAKEGAPPKARKPRPKKASPRLRARWGVFDGSMKQVAIFDYNDRASADEKLADLREKKKGLYFMQIVKEPMPEDAAGPHTTQEMVSP
jgi:hypothetical protein